MEEVAVYELKGSFVKLRKHHSDFLLEALTDAKKSQGPPRDH